MLSDTRRGVGWGLGFGAVIGAGSVLLRGPRQTLKVAMKATIGLRAAAADAAERVADVYAEAASERAREQAEGSRTEA
jgi:hypothetical protein